MVKVRSVLVSLFFLCSFLSADNEIKVESRTAAAGATGVTVRVLADCDQLVTALSFAASYDSRISVTDTTLTGTDIETADWKDLDINTSEHYFTVGIIIEYRDTASAEPWQGIESGTDHHILNVLCDIASGVADDTQLNIDLREDLGSPPVRAVFTSDTGTTIVPTLTDGAITIVPGPVVSSVSPTWGPVEGGTSITITGSNFRDGCTVTIGGAALLDQVYVSSTEIQGTTPAHATAESVDVTVDNGSEYGSGTLTDGFTYVHLPEIDSITPDEGPTAGGTSVTIKGNYFQSTTTVTIGGSELGGTVVVDSQTITGTTPAHATAESVDVVVTNTYDGDTVSDTLADGFTYVAPPTISSIVPNEGHGDVDVVITGTNFRPGDTTVTFGGTEVTVTSVTATEIQCHFPGCSENGWVEVTVTTTGGSDTVAEGYLCTNTFRRGDANCDGASDENPGINIADAVYMLDYLFNQGPSKCLDAHDANDDGRADISDAVYVLMYLFGGGSAPPAPFPTLGTDPTPPSLGCANQCGS